MAQSMEAGTTKSYIITGAYGGLGLALAKNLAARKAKLVIAGKDEEKLNAVLKELEPQTQAVAVRADITKVRDCKRLIDACVSSYGRLDVMVNNAGVLEDGLKPNLVDKLIDANLKGLEYCSYYAIAQMKRQREGGVLVNVASTSGVFLKPKEDEAVYASSKFGVVAYSASLHLAYKDSKIRVVCFCPGGMKTNLFRQNPERMLQDFMNPEAAARVLLGQIDAGRYGLSVLLRRGLLQYSKDFSLSWQWTAEENMDLNKV